MSVRSESSLKLIQSTDESLCLTRIRRGRGFQYRFKNHRRITAKPVLRRIRSLAIPPMWNEVQICNRKNGHIQATGRDSKGRKQYIYHPHWQLARQQEKYQRLSEFAIQLPVVRRHCRKLLRKPGWSREKILALMVMILDETGIRIGNREYRDTNHSYGLSTLRRKHLIVKGRSIFFDFPGKSGQNLQVELDNPQLAALVKKCAELPGYNIFRYQDDEGSWQEVDSDDVNTFIHSLIGEEYSSKDFRTWTASRLVIEFYPETLQELRDESGADRPKSKTQRQTLINRLVKRVAAELGNTPPVCRCYYIHPVLLDEAGTGKMPVLDEKAIRASRERTTRTLLSPAERATLKILARY